MLSIWVLYCGVLVKDAQRHGLRIKLVDVSCSDWNCTLEMEQSGTYSVRLELRYVQGLRRTSAIELLNVRAVAPFKSIDMLAHRVPVLSQAELATLASIGASNKFGTDVHRRNALWQVERAIHKLEPLFFGSSVDEDCTAPLGCAESGRAYGC